MEYAIKILQKEIDRLQNKVKDTYDPEKFYSSKSNQGKIDELFRAIKKLEPLIKWTGIRGIGPCDNQFV